VPETVVEAVTGWRVPPGDVEAWAQALQRAVAMGPERWAIMGRAGRERARRLFSVEAMASATLEVYARVLRDRAR
jgi:glycosyltransferase involved in cell wall biosynthesis